MEQKFFEIDPRLEKLGEQAQQDCAQAFARAEEIGEYNSRKVLAAFIHNGVILPGAPAMDMTTGAGRHWRQ